jgi:hypothetical protein
MFFLCNRVASAYGLEPIHPVLFMSALFQTATDTLLIPVIAYNFTWF